MANSSLFQELRRRKVFRVAVAYMVIAWLLLQVVDVIAPMLELPGWVGKFVLLLLVVGLPISIFLAWAFELTPDGVRRDTGSDAVPAVMAVGVAVKLSMLTGIGAGGDAAINGSSTTKY